MNVNVLVAAENYITSIGLATIISDNIIASNITTTLKSEVVSKITDKIFDIVVFDFQKNNLNDFELVKYISETDSKVKLIIHTSRGIDGKYIRFLRKNNIGLILEDYSNKRIVDQLKFYQINIKNSSLRVKNKVKSQEITSLLSNRELEMALLLINGQTLTSISESKNLAMTTVSTYKKRIFEKTKVKNLIELSQLFQKLANNGQFKS